jgi:hypothetical protein
MGHNVGDAAARSVAKSQKAETVKARTPEQRIKDIRMNAEGILSVPNKEVVFLLERLDLVLSELAKTQISLSAANLRIAELDQVAFKQGQQLETAQADMDSIMLPVAEHLGVKVAEYMNERAAEAVKSLEEAQEAVKTTEPVDVFETPQFSDGPGDEPKDSLGE